MAYPQVAEICTLVRNLLLDARVATGEIYTDDVILPVMAIPWRELWDALIDSGTERPRQTFYHVLEAYSIRFYPEKSGVVNFAEPLKIEEAAPGTTLNVGLVEEHSTGEIRLETTVPHGLADNTRVFVSGLPEPAAGEWFVYGADATHLVLRGSVFYGAFSENSGKVTPLANGASFTSLSPVRTWARRDPAATLGEYRWHGEYLQLHGATAARLLAVEAFLTAPPFPVSTGDPLRVDNCHNFMAYRTAALLAAANGRDDLFQIYSTLAFSDKGDGQGGFLAGLTGTAPKAEQRQRVERP